jgi:MYND finger
MGEMLGPWTIHRLNLSRLPILDFTATKIEEWLEPHVGSMMSTRERSLRKNHGTNTLMFIKDTLNTIFVGTSGTQLGPRRRVFNLQDQATKNCDTLFFITELRFDLHCHTMICDGYVLPLTRDLLRKIEKPFAKLLQHENLGTISALEGEMQAWKKLIPAFVERCRSWTHGANCEYLAQRNIPLTEEMELDPLCSCGRGKDTEGMSKVALWRNFAPYVTRIALSPLFAVSYLETVGRDPKCSVCRGKGKPKLLTCTACKAVKYCSKDCQKKDWKVHKQRCNS